MSLQFLIHTTYKEVAFCFQPSGSSIAELLEVLEPETIDEVRSRQIDGVVKSADDDVLLTLVAVKILNEHYEDKITLWGLIERKAKAYC